MCLCSGSDIGFLGLGCRADEVEKFKASHPGWTSVCKDELFRMNSTNQAWIYNHSHVCYIDNSY